MRILTITNLFPRPDRPQMGLFNWQLFRAFADAGVEVRNICLVPEWRMWVWSTIKSWHKCGDDRSPWSVVCSLFFPVLYLPVIGRSFAAELYYRSLRGRLKKSDGVDFVYSPWLYPDGVVAARIASDLSVPFALMALGSDVFHMKAGGRKKEKILEACKSAKFIICVATHLKKALVEAGVDEDKIHVVENGVDASVFKYRNKEETLAKLDHACGLVKTGNLKLDESKTVIFVGNLVSVKNPGLAIAAFAKLVELEESPQQLTANNYQLIVIGEGKERRALERQAVQLGVSENVHFLGSRSHEKVALWMNVADCLCLSSRSEGMPNVVIEALTSGLPVVATDVGECRRILADDPNSRVVASDDADMMAKALDDALNMDVDKEAMAERYKGKYSWERPADVILGMLGS